jgi:hypothetical protein
VELVELYLLVTQVILQFLEWFLLAVAVVGLALVVLQQEYMVEQVVGQALQTTQELLAQYLIQEHLLAQVQVELGMAQAVEMQILEQVRLGALE